MKLCPDWNSQQQSEIRKTRYLSWLVTKLGVTDGESSTSVGSEEPWSLRRAELVLSAETPSAALSVSNMIFKSREMCVTCSWQDCVVDTELDERSRTVAGGDWVVSIRGLAFSLGVQGENA
jgi:hypothetical protein